MNIQEIRQLIRIVEKSDIDELEIVEEGRKIRISKNQPTPQLIGPGNGTTGGYYVPSPSASTPAAAAEPAVPTRETTSEETATDSDKYYEVRSPMVGTFYRAPAPDAAPYVEVGDTVSPGQTLCIIEAMKLMNEIQAEVGGKIAKILVENAQPVEYNQLLFLIEKT